MRTKAIAIDGCESCPFFDNRDYEFVQQCTKTGKHFEFVSAGVYPIPDNCPLPDAPETKEGT